MTALTHLTALERSKLDTAEQVIAESMKTFVEVGESLATIKNERLYRDTHDTFEGYCRERWGWTSGRARQLVDAASIAADVKINTMVSIPNERTARAVAKVPPARRAEVVSRAAEAGPVSSASIARAAKQTPPPKRVKPAKLIDQAGREYDDPQVIEALGRAGEFDTLINEVHAIKRKILKLGEESVGKELRPQIESDFKNIVAAIRFGTPYTTCVYMPNCKRGCQLCGGARWITKEQFERVPEEDR